MTKGEAKKIGGRQGLFSVGIGLLIAQLIMTFFISSDIGFARAFFWFMTFDCKINIVVGAVIMLLCGHFYSEIAGEQILLKKRNFIIVGFLCGMAVLLTTAFFSGWMGFFQEGFENVGTNDNPFFDYIFKPFYWVTLFGIVPALLIGIWFGKQVKSKGEVIK